MILFHFKTAGRAVYIFLVLLILFNSFHGIYALAENIEFIDLDVFSGEYTVGDISEPAIWSSTDESVAKVADGKIIAGESGVARVMVTSSQGIDNAYYVSVRYPYPQPKTAKINQNNVRLCKWAKSDSTDYTGVKLEKGDIVTILYRVDDSTAAEGVIPQYVKTADGQYGYITNKDSNDRPMAEYYPELQVGESINLGTYNGENVFYSDQDWSKSNDNVTVNKKADSSADITATSVGTATVTSSGNNANGRYRPFKTKVVIDYEFSGGY